MRWRALCAAPFLADAGYAIPKSRLVKTTTPNDGGLKILEKKGVRPWGEGGNRMRPNFSKQIKKNSRGKTCHAFLYLFFPKMSVSTRTPTVLLSIKLSTGSNFKN